MTGLILNGVRRRVTGALSSLVAVLCLLPSPVQASIDVDFNRDGVLDAVLLPRPPATNIVVQISGLAPQVLKLSGPLISVIVADIDRDGTLDLAALSGRRGMRVWLNKAGLGRFATLKKLRLPRGFGIFRHHRAAVPHRGYEASGASGTQRHASFAHLPWARIGFAPPDSSTHCLSSCLRLPEGGNASASRGPPPPA